MTTKDAFTDEEWDKVRTLPVMVIAGAVFADGRKLVTSVSETVAGFETYRKGAEQFPDNELLQALIASEDAGIAKPPIPKEASLAEAVDAIADEVQQAVDLAQPKADPREWQQVGEVLLAAAMAAAERKGSGALGFGGEKVQPEEQAYLDRISVILGQSPASPAGAGTSAPDGDDSE